MFLYYSRVGLQSKRGIKVFFHFFFQIIILWWGGWLLLYILGLANISSLKEICLITTKHWFVMSYIVLLILAPILNTFVQNASEKKQRFVLLGFFIFTCTCGWIGGAKRFYVEGYGPLLFIGLYLLAYYVHNTSKNASHFIKQLFTFRRRTDLLIYLSCVLINTLSGIIFIYLNRDYYRLIYAYVNPFTIIGSTYLLLFFSKLSIKNYKIINIMSSGSFAVYLLHTESDINHYFTAILQFFYNSYSGCLCISIILIFLIVVYIGCVIIDLPRKWAWNKISNHFQIF